MPNIIGPKVEELLAEGLSWKEISERLGVTWQTARSRYRRYKGTHVSKPVELETPKERISVTRDGDAEVFLIDGVSYRIPSETKRSIYALYSRDGANVQIADIELEFGIPRSAFEAIKNYWGLTHSSPMWPDEDIANRDADELVEEGLANRKRLLHRRFKARERAWYKEQYEKLAHRSSLEDRLIDVARETLTAWEPPRIVVPYRKTDTERRLYLALSDWHVGKRTLPVIASPGFSTGILRERVARLQEGVARAIRDVSFGIEEVIVALHGDMVDNPDGTTYPRQDRGQDLHDWQQLLEASKLISEFIYFVASVAKRVSVVVVPGNHGKTYDTAAAYMAMQRLSNCEHVSFDIAETPFATLERGRNQFIVLHGDTLRGGSSRENDIMKAVMMMGKPGYRHYVTFGHLHHRNSKQALMKEGTGYEWYLCPSMVGGDEYSEHRMFATSRPAQLALMVDDDEGVLYPRTLYVD